MPSRPPGDIATKPNTYHIPDNAPYSERDGYLVRQWYFPNDGARRIGWAVETTNLRRLLVDPPSGVLDPNEGVVITVTSDLDDKDASDQRMSLEWTNAPEGAAKQFRREWLQGDGMVHRTNLPIKYNS